MRLHHDFGIDIGTSTVKIYDHRSDRIQKERNMIAIREGRSVHAIGNEAYRLFGRSPDSVEVVTPMTNGRISDVFLMEAVLHTLLARCQSRTGHRPAIYLSVPTDMTEIERRAYYTVAHRGKLRRSRIFLVEKPFADAIAFDIPLRGNSGSMIVNMGAQSTDLSVVADARVIISRAIPSGGHSINDAIIAAVRRKNQFLISEKTAKRLKLSLTDLDGAKMEARKVDGIDTANGLPRTGIVTTYTVTQAVEAQLAALCEEITRFLQRIPPQIRTGILDEGIYFCGGGTRFPGLPRFLNDHLDCAVRISGQYDLHTICGIKELIRDGARFDDLPILKG